MNNKLSLALIISATLFLSACNDDEPVKTVEHYKSSEQERAEKLKECGNNPGQKTLTANCLNARKADNIEAEKSTGTIKIDINDLKD
jgi:hypothetical protein